MSNIRIEVSGLDGEIGIKEYLLSLGYSITFIKKVKYGGILLGSSPVTVRATVKNGDVIELVPPVQKSENIPPIEIPIRVIFEDDDLVVFDKPTNMPTHPSRGNSLPTLANAAVAKYGENDERFILLAL